MPTSKTSEFNPVQRWRRQYGWRIVALRQRNYRPSAPTQQTVNTGVRVDRDRPVVAKPRLNNFLGGAILSLISVALCLIVAELFFTFLYKQRQAHLEQEKAGDILCTHRSKFLELIYTRIPNRCGANSHGYRDYEYPYKKEPGLSRVVVIGDSVADAYGIDLGAGFGKLLESALNQSRA